MAATLALLCGRVPAGLSDSSYVSHEPSTVPPDRQAQEERDVRIINTGEASGRAIGMKDAPRMGPRSTLATPTPFSLHENDATQVMSELPAGIREATNLEVEIPIDVQAGENAEPGRIPAETVQAERRPLTHARTNEAPTSRSDKAPKPTAAQIGAASNRRYDANDSDDDAVQLFNAADLAASIAKEVKVHKRRQARKEMLAAIDRFKLPIVVGALVLLAAIATVLVLGSK